MIRNKSCFPLPSIFIVIIKRFFLYVHENSFASYKPNNRNMVYENGAIVIGLSYINEFEQFEDFSKSKFFSCIEKQFLGISGSIAIFPMFNVQSSLFIKNFHSVEVNKSKKKNKTKNIKVYYSECIILNQVLDKSDICSPTFYGSSSFFREKQKKSLILYVHSIFNSFFFEYSVYVFNKYRTNTNIQNIIAKKKRIMKLIPKHYEKHLPSLLLFIIYLYIHVCINTNDRVLTESCLVNGLVFITTPIDMHIFVPNIVSFNSKLR